MKVAVLGGGPGGLVTLKFLTQAHEFLATKPIEVRRFEADSGIGGTFRQRTYEDAEQVSSKYLTAFSDFRPSKETPDFMPIVDYVKYLEEYCTMFGLWSCIELSTTVTQLRRRGTSGHVVSLAKADGTIETWDCDAVAICTGLHVTPNMPELKGVEHIPLVLHSSQFKVRKQFGEGKNVVVLGTGETGVPNPVLFGHFGPGGPGPDIPTDVSTASLFESMYVHPIMRSSLIPWRYYDAFVKSTLWLVSGTRHGIDQWVGGLPDETYHTEQLFFTKSSRAMPYISAPYRSKSILQRIRSSILQVNLPDTKGRVIDMAPWPSHIDEDGIIYFTESRRPEAEKMRYVRRKVDVLIFATGYDQKFPFLDESYPRPENADIRRIWKTGDESVGYIGFVRPSFGAIPPLAEFQAQLWVLALLKQLPHPLVNEEHYRLHLPKDRRIQYGVDHENYAYQLAMDMESAPSASYVFCLGPKMFITWALGANFNTKFRLIGPWAFKGAEEIMKEELWQTITRRGGFFGLVVLSAIPMSIFGPINVFVWLLASVGLL
ncbi:FAD protein [Coleophoma cylindrospora]|uniref:FAD protein n=1 Tax=Coleophoma cylindrospora TaxID=1849047 RepID=A0A3D8RNK1_9HELO|nr:FAD protein [Coleophoma cylindrospora]